MKKYYYNNSRSVGVQADCHRLTESMSVERLRITVPPNFKLWRNKSNCPTGPCCWYRVLVAVNALMRHRWWIQSSLSRFSKGIQADYITVGDAGVFVILKQDGYHLNHHDTSTMVTSSLQISFWGKQAGASEAVLAASAELFMWLKSSDSSRSLGLWCTFIHHFKTTFSKLLQLSRQKRICDQDLICS